MYGLGSPHNEACASPRLIRGDELSCDRCDFKYIEKFFFLHVLCLFVSDWLVN